MQFNSSKAALSSGSSVSSSPICLNGKYPFISACLRYKARDREPHPSTQNDKVRAETRINQNGHMHTKGLSAVCIHRYAALKRRFSGGCTFRGGTKVARLSSTGQNASLRGETFPEISRKQVDFPRKPQLSLGFRLSPFMVQPPKHRLLSSSYTIVYCHMTRFVCGVLLNTLM